MKLRTLLLVLAISLAATLSAQEVTEKSIAGKWKIEKVVDIETRKTMDVSTDTSSMAKRMRSEVYTFREDKTFEITGSMPATGTYKIRKGEEATIVMNDKGTGEETEMLIYFLEGNLVMVYESHEDEEFETGSILYFKKIKK